MSYQEDTWGQRAKQSSDQNQTNQLVDAQMASDLLRKEALALSELKKIDLGTEMNEQAVALLKQLKTLESGILARISFLEKSQKPRTHFAQNSHQFLADVDLSGVTVVIAEFGEKTELMPRVIDTAHSNTQYKSGMFSHLDDNFMARKRSFIARSDGREDSSFHISMRGLSYQNPASEGNGNLIRKIEKDKQHLGQIHNILLSTGDHAIDVVSPEEGVGLFDTTFEGGIIKVALAYIIGPDNKDNRTIIDAVRASLRKGNYEIGNENTLLENDLEKLFPNLKLKEKAPGLQLHRIHGIAKAKEL